MDNGRHATVAIAHTQEKHRSQDRVLGLVEAALLEIGGLSQFVPPGATVLLKPNQTIYYSAEEGCTTDPLVVGALIRLAQKAGAARVQVAESSGGFFSSLECMRVTGMAAVAEKEGAELIDLGSDDVLNRTVAVPGGKVLQQVPLPVPLLEADVIINVPKAKTHFFEPISGALKNWVGVVNQGWREQNHGDEDMVARYLDILSLRPPQLCVVDALIVGEGDGPIATQPRWCGCILASTDPVATDVSIARLLGLDWQKLKFAREAEARGLGVRQPIDYVGGSMDDVAIRAWPGHEDFDYLPVKLLVGRGVTMAGTLGHVKSALDSLLRRGHLEKVIGLKGTPTIMVGEADDPEFEAHLREGPYVVFDDAARPQYKSDRRVYFVPGHPVLRRAMPELMKGLGVDLPSKAVARWDKFQRATAHSLRYGSAKRKAVTIAKPLAAAGVTVAGVVVAAALIRMLASKAAPAAEGGECEAD